VSRPTLRAALALLEKEGCLESRHGLRRTIIKKTPSQVREHPKVIALLTPLPLQELVPFTQAWTDSLRAFLAKEGYELQIHSGRRWYGTNPERELAKLTHEMPAAGWVLFVTTEAMQRWFWASGLVCVTSGSPHAGIPLPSVDLNHRATCRHAAGQFLARGHERVVFLRQGPTNAGDKESELGFLEAFQKKPEATALVAEHDGTPEGIRKQVDLLCRRKARPTGFLVARAMPALAVASELTRKGLRIPEDVSVICRDRDHFMDYFSPAIARYGVDPQTHAQRLARLILQYARDGSQKTKQVRLTTQFFAGESVGTSTKTAR